MEQKLKKLIVSKEQHHKWELLLVILIFDVIKNQSNFFIFVNYFSLGNHECVAIINNYVPKESVYYFTRKQPFEEKAKLPIELAKPLHQLVMLVSSMDCKI